MKTKQRNLLLSVLENWEEGLARIGECIVHFQQIEDRLDDCIAALISGDYSLGRLLTSQFSYRNKVALFEQLFTYRSKDLSIEVSISELWSRLKWAEETRNVIVHSVWHLSEKTPSHLVRVKGKRSTGSKETKLVRVDELDDYQRTFEGIEDDVCYYMTECFPKYNSRLGRFINAGSRERRKTVIAELNLEALREKP